MQLFGPAVLGVAVIKEHQEPATTIDNDTQHTQKASGHFWIFPVLPRLKQQQQKQQLKNQQLSCLIFLILLFICI